MEGDSVTVVHDPHDGSTRSEPSEPVKLETALAGDRKHQSSTETVQASKIDTGDSENVKQGVDPADKDFGDVNMEASISADDVMRAGGFGARDDISSFLPVASDSTDFEASLLNARDYEEPQNNICRPGLGWKDVRD